MADRSLEELNRALREDARAVIEAEDARYRAFVTEVAERVTESGNVRILLLAGPSGSGKTTTANMIADAVRARGHESHVVSLDNFYREAHDPYYPKKPDGTRDFESCDALDLPLACRTLRLAAQGEAFDVPHYDFKSGCYFPEPYRFGATEDGLLIVEGLHALNPVLTEAIPHDRCVKLFISVSTNLTYGAERVLSGRKLRFVRRLVRDSLYRGASADLTLSMWPGVLHGEDTYLYPYRDAADICMDTFHAYEAGLMAPFALRVLNEATDKDDFVRTVCEAMRLSHPIEDALVPQDALMREFIPGGKYEHLY